MHDALPTRCAGPKEDRGMIFRAMPDVHLADDEAHVGCCWRSPTYGRVDEWLKSPHC